MNPNIVNYIGIDIASEDFTVTLFQAPDKQKLTKESIPNSNEGYKIFSAWLKEQNVSSGNSIFCMEATGVYGESLAYYLLAQGYSVVVEPPLKVKRAFDTVGHKNDPVDSRQIAEYAYRFTDELRIYRPRPENIEKLKHYLTVREQLVKQSISIQNALKAYKRHPLQDKRLIAIQEQNLAQVKEHIENIDKCIKDIIKSDPSLHDLSLLLISLCGVGILLATYLLVTTNGFQDITHYKQLAAFIGICPYQFTSGKSISKRPHCRGFGTTHIKNMLHLAARSVIRSDPYFKRYYFRKVEEGKDKMLVLNNIANKLLKISFALVKNKQSYIKNYHSVNPMVLK